MSIDWNKVKSNAKAKDDQQYAAMKADTEKRGPYSVSTGTSQPTGFTPAKRSEMASIENQRRQASNVQGTRTLYDQRPTDNPRAQRA